jgi:signal transduction histidine kinase
VTGWLGRFLPRTLGAQLVVVTAGAVLISNIAVAVWFARVDQNASQNAITDRLLDRVTSATVVLAAIPAKERDAAANAMSTPLLQLAVRHGKPTPIPMTAQEAQMAARIRGSLSRTHAKQPVFVHSRRATLQEQRVRGASANGTLGPVIAIEAPVVRNTVLVATFYSPPGSPWPLQITIAALVAIITASAAGAVIARRVARPLSALAASASEAARGETARHVPEEGPEDVKRAAAAFNAMTDQVARTLASQRQLLSAVGHDLRTPITALRINTEFIEDEEVRERLQKNLEELQDLTEAVLSAAKGAGGEPKRNVDLAALVESVCTDLDEMGKPVTWRQHAPAPVSCRPNEIRRAVRNLIENAVAYGQQADVRLENGGDCYEVVVEDTGPGIPQGDHARVFEPFVRLETSRSADTGGSGLGLTLVRAIAQGHGGGIALDNRDEGGLRATLSLPRNAPSA